MAKTRLEMLGDLAKDPKNAFARYGLAMELARLARVDESAQAFAALATDLPDYVPTYFQAGKVLEKAQRLDEARDFYRRGIDAATRAGNAHAREELEGALGMIS